MQDQFEKLGLQAERVEATTPTDLSQADRDRYCNPAHRYWLHETELSCTLSHLAAMRLLLESAEPYVAVFEDDVVLSSRLPEVLAAFETSPPHSQLLRLETDNRGVRLSSDRSQMLGNFTLIQSRGPTSGSAGYIVTRSAARAILDSSRMLDVPVDHALFNPYERLARRLDMRHLDPAVCAQWDRLGDTNSALSKVSDLDEARINRPVREKLSPISRVLRQFQDTIEREIVVGTRQTYHSLTGAKKRVIPMAD
jgi:GR25 family glycosyltransferase involved in LPS biosynthesis